ncbi:MAG: glycosyltransferase family 4 protein [bacterium]|nr:glycosyltransferase family 4 protein [bacterium]
MNVLLVAEYFSYPSVDGRSARGARTVGLLLSQGISVTVLCAESGDIEPVPGLVVLNAGPDKIGLRQVPLKLLGIADGRVGLIARLLEQLATTPGVEAPDLVITSSAPYEVHAVGFYLKQAYNMCWVAEFRDGWTTNPVRSTKRITATERWLERRVLSRADLVLFNTVGQAALALAQVGVPTKWAVSRNGVPPPTTHPLPKPQVRSGPLRLGYFGGLRGYAAERNGLNALVRAADLGEMDISLEVFGPRRDWVTEDHNLQKLVKFRGELPSSELRKAAAGCDAMVLFLNPGPRSAGWVQQKTYDYVAAEIPVLAVGDGSEEALDILATRSRVRCVPDGASAKALCSALDELLDPASTHPELGQVTIERTHAELIALLRR